jgi:hypothetical protein
VSRALNSETSWTLQLTWQGLQRRILVVAVPIPARLAMGPAVLHIALGSHSPATPPSEVVSHVLEIIVHLPRWKCTIFIWPMRPRCEHLLATHPEAGGWDRGVGKGRKNQANTAHRYNTRCRHAHLF